MELETNYKGDSFLLVVRNSGSVWLGVEKWRDGKNEFEKFTHIPLLKNNAQLKQKSDK